MEVDIEPLTASDFALETPLPNETIKGSIASVQANVASRGHEIIRAGQVRAGNRLWVWHESRMRSSAFEQGPFESGRAWIFTATPAKHRMTIYCSVLYERGASSEIIAAKTRRAGAVFAGMLERLSVEPR